MSTVMGDSEGEPKIVKHERVTLAGESYLECGILLAQVNGNHWSQHFGVGLRSGTTDHSFSLAVSTKWKDWLRCK